jgi:hypothetical protein
LEPVKSLMISHPYTLGRRRVSARAARQLP